MSFKILYSDVKKVRADAIVVFSGFPGLFTPDAEKRVMQVGGPRLSNAKAMLARVAAGSAAITNGYDLPVKHVIHAVGSGDASNTKSTYVTLLNCCISAFTLAHKHKCSYMVFYISPKHDGSEIANIVQVASQELAHSIRIDYDVMALPERLSTGMLSDISDYIYSRSVQELPCAPVMQSSAPAPEDPFLGERTVESLQAWFGKADIGFSEHLLNLIDKSGKKDSDIYKKANVSRQHFSKIRNNPNYKPNKATAVALGIALELDIDALESLIGKAGYSLTHSNKFDLIIRYFVEHKIYNIMKINMALYEFDQTLLGT